MLEDIPFWANGLGLTSGQRSQLYIHDPASGVTTPLTAPPFKVTGFTVEDGRILYTGHRFTDVQTLRHGVFIWDAASGETRCLLEQDRYLVKLFALWRDQAVLCLTDGLGYGNGENGDFYTIPLSEENQSCSSATAIIVWATPWPPTAALVPERPGASAETRSISSPPWTGTAGLRLWI